VKDLLYGKLYYGPFPISTSPVYDVEITMFDDGLILSSFSYSEYKRARLPDYQKTTYDISPDETEEKLVKIWSELLSRVKISWSIRRFIDNFTLWIVKRKLAKSIRGGERYIHRIIVFFLNRYTGACLLWICPHK